MKGQPPALRKAWAKRKYEFLLMVKIAKREFKDLPDVQLTPGFPITPEMLRVGSKKK